MSSGGGCDIVADSVGLAGLEIPQFTDKTVARVTPLVPDFAHVRNPLDITPAAYRASTSGEPLTALDHTLDILAEDPNLDLIMFDSGTVRAAPPPGEEAAKAAGDRLDWLVERMASSPIPLVPIRKAIVDAGDWGRELLTQRGIYVAPGLNASVAALGKSVRWLENRGRLRLAPELPPGGREVSTSGPWSEMRARQLLESAGMPVVPGELVSSADEAAAAASRLGLPVVLKIQSEQIIHKSDIGGVALRLDSEAEVRAAFEKVYCAGRAVAGAVIDGVLVTPMRSGGLELLAGVTKDPTFGPVLAVGLGGVWVEIMQDTSVRVLPVDAEEVKSMLTELRAAPLLLGARGSQPVDLDALAAMIARLGDTAVSLGDALGALEVNPLWVNGSQIEALDVLVVTERGA
jgi:acyl-CoA synthetase (NDP forming)